MRRFRSNQAHSAGRCLGPTGQIFEHLHRRRAASEHSGSGVAGFVGDVALAATAGPKKIRCQRVLKIPAENPVDGYIVLWYLEATIFLAAVSLGFRLVGLQQEFDVLAVGADIKERRQQDGKQDT